VRAVFAHSFYVSLDAGWVAIVDAGLGPGPLNVVCEPWPRGLALGAMLRPGDAACIAGQVLAAGGLGIALARAVAWLPQPSTAWDPPGLARGLASVSEVLRQGALADALGLLPGLGASRGPAASRVAAPLAYLAQLLQGDGAAVVPAIDAARLAPLIGLGPGLTPAGDDYLGGVLVALDFLGRTRLRDGLWQALAPLLGARTSEISRAHLAAAAAGFGSAALHQALAAIVAGAREEIAAAIGALSAVGHTSGLDALAGALAVLRRA
jgi:hypothetical protein